MLKPSSRHLLFLVTWTIGTILSLLTLPQASAMFSTAATATARNAVNTAFDVLTDTSSSVQIIDYEEAVDATKVPEIGSDEVEFLLPHRPPFHRKSV